MDRLPAATLLGLGALVVLALDEGELSIEPAVRVEPPGLESAAVDCRGDGTPRLAGVSAIGETAARSQGLDVGERLLEALIRV